MRVGDFEILPVVDGVLTVPATLFFPTVSEEKWEPYDRFLAAPNTIDMPTGGFLIRGQDVLALVDVGMGYIERDPKMGGRLLESLTELGHSASDITDVLFSHLHFDHIGWSSKDGVPVFENATYRCHSKDWDHFMTQGISQGPFADYLGLPGTDQWLGPVEDRIETWDGGSSVLPGINVADAPGHTPGSTILVISSGAERAILLGDAVHCPVEMLDSEFEVVGDVDPELAKRTREAIAKEYEGSDVHIAAPHFPGMEFGRLMGAEGKRSWVVP
ncbi:MAG: MBL fold metallo-hydrolase [Actinomycetota bacterium]